MLNVKKVLFPTDFFPSANQALDHALYLAKRHGAELHMLHAIVLHQEDPHNPAAHVIDLDEMKNHLEALAEKDMEDAIQHLPDDSPEIIKAQVRGVAAADVILEYAQDHDIDLIVMGTQGRRGLEHLLLGSTAAEVLRLSTCPVLTIRERQEPLTPEGVLRILVPVDYSDHAKAAMDHAREMASAYEAEVDLLHVIENLVHPVFYWQGGSSGPELRQDVEERATEALERLWESSRGPDVKVRCHVIRGNAGRDIDDFAREHDSDLIVIATHGLTGLSKLLLGSVTEKVIRTAPCPVFTVKSFGRSLV
jgi:nucleotide-binding universal stress UspA family protein